MPQIALAGTGSMCSPSDGDDPPPQLPLGDVEAGHADPRRARASRARSASRSRAAGSTAGPRSRSGRRRSARRRRTAAGPCGEGCPSPARTRPRRPHPPVRATWDASRSDLYRGRARSDQGDPRRPRRAGTARAALDGRRRRRGERAAGGRHLDRHDGRRRALRPLPARPRDDRPPGPGGRAVGPRRHGRDGGRGVRVARPSRGCRRVRGDGAGRRDGGAGRALRHHDRRRRRRAGGEPGGDGGRDRLGGVRGRPGGPRRRARRRPRGRDRAPGRRRALAESRRAASSRGSPRAARWPPRGPRR